MPASTTNITIDGTQEGPQFYGIGAISGGGGNARLLVDYPEPQRSQILDYLFKPNYGATIQILKLEIGGDCNTSDGAEPSCEHSQGVIDADTGYNWWLAEQALARNSNLKIFGLQWGAPGWVKDPNTGKLWTQNDIDYVLDWLGVAAQHGITVHYLGGWNERFDPTTDANGVQWFKDMRAALDANGYGDVQLVASDSISSNKWAVADVMTDDPAFNDAVQVIGVHDNCGYPANDTDPFGYSCGVSSAARALHKPMFASEDGRMDKNNGGTLARILLNSYVDAGMTGIIQYPLITSMVPNLVQENRGLITANWPWSGHYEVNKLLWVTAQMTQFVPQGWFHVNGANHVLGDSGLYNVLEDPGHHQWSLIAENTGSYNGQNVSSQTMDVQLTGGLNRGTVHVWGTYLWDTDTTRYLKHLTDITPGNGEFSYTVPPGWMVSLTSRGVAVRDGASTDPSTPAETDCPLPWTPSVDDAGMPKLLSPMNGAFAYAPARGGRTGDVIEQASPQVPVLWANTEPQYPYALVGDNSWADYTVSSDVLLSVAGATAGLDGRFSGHPGLAVPAPISGYRFTLSGEGLWQLSKSSATTQCQTTLDQGVVMAFDPTIWHTLTLTLDGATITAAIDSVTVATITDTTWTQGPAGIETSWDTVQFDNLTVTA